MAKNDARRVTLTEAFFHPRFGVVLWHDCPDEDVTFVLTARLNDESRVQHFVDEYVAGAVIHDKPRFSAN